MKYIFIAERCSDLPVSTCCRVLKVSTSGFYQRRNQPVTERELGEAYAANEVHDIWKMSRHSYGAPRVRTELRLGRGVRRSKTTCERLMRVCGAAGIHYRRRNQGCTRPGDGDINDDLVNRAFDPEQPDQWVFLIRSSSPSTRFSPAQLIVKRRRRLAWRARRSRSG